MKLLWQVRSAVATFLRKLDGLIVWVGRLAASVGFRVESFFRPLQRIPNALEASTARATILIGLTVASAVLLTVLSSLDAVLRELHDQGGEIFGIGSLSNRFFSLASSEHFREVLDTWDRVASEASASSASILWTYAVTDILFVAAYTLLLGVMLVGLDRALGESGDEQGSLIGRPPEVVEVEQMAAATKRLSQREVASSDWNAELAVERARVRASATSSRAPLRIAFAALFVLATADVAENVLVFTSPWVDGNGSQSVWAWLLWLAFRVKWIAFAFVAVPALVAALTFLVLRPLRRRHIWNALVVARGPLLVIALLYAGLFVSDQSIDAIRRWRDDGWDAAFATILLMWTALIAVASTGELLELSDKPRQQREAPARLVSLALLAGATAVVAWYFWDAWLGLATLGGIFFLVAILSAPLGDLGPEKADRGAGAARAWLPALVGIAVCVLPALAIIRATTGPLILEQYYFDKPLLRLEIPLVVLLLLGALLAWTPEFLARAWSGRRRWLLIGASMILLAFIVVRIYRNPLRISEAFGAVAFLAAFLLALTLLLYFASRRGERICPPKVISLVRLDRTPFILLAIVWIAVAAQLDGETTYHDVRRLEPAGLAHTNTPHTGITAKGVFTRWLTREPRSAKPRPLLLVAAAGGGIRAAYWTSAVLRCVLEGSGTTDACQEGGSPASERGPGSLFAASGISGGSLGLASYVAHFSVGSGNDWPSRRLDDDYTAPVIAWALFVDLPSALVRRTGGSDRAEILERAFERSWLDDLPDRNISGVLWRDMPSTDMSALGQGLIDTFESQSTAQPVPVLMLNGTKVQEGCRLNVSVLDAAVDRKAPRSEKIVEDCLSLRQFEVTQGIDTRTREKWAFASSDDLATYLCEGDDVRLSTAVMLSARFPFVVPSGRLTRCGADNRSPANVVDGGYFDTSGASPLVELWGDLTREVTVANRDGHCIVPYLLQIDTGYADPVKSGDRSPQEALVPPVTVRRARDAREHNARQAAALLFTGEPEVGPKVSNRYAHIYPKAHPGVRAPLGWTLSDAAQDELDDQLLRNSEEIKKVRRWLADETPCLGHPGWARQQLKWKQAGQSPLGK